MEERWITLDHPLQGERDVYPVISSLGRYKLTPTTTRITCGFVDPRNDRCYLVPAGTERRKSKARWMCWAFFPAARMMEDCKIPWVSDHIDDDKTNDVLSNLQVLTPSESSRKTSKMPTRRSNGPKKSRPIDQLTKSGEFIRSWPSVAAAADATANGIRANIRAVACGRIPFAAKCKWRYKDTDLPGEMWTRCKLPQFSGIAWSNLGRIRNLTGVVSEGTDSFGYRVTRIRGKSCRIHRLIGLEAMHEAYLAVKARTGEEPQIDHIDRDRANNRIENLRWVTRLENAQNRTPRHYKTPYQCN